MKKKYLIDVFNLLYKWPETKDLMHKNQLEKAEIIFLNKVLSFSNNTNCTCHLFFDGMNENLSSKWNYPNLKIVFCHPQTADARIKSFLRNNYRKNKNLVTVSDDAEIKSHSRRFDFKAMNADDFLNLLRQPAANKKNLNSGNEKPRDVSDYEVEEYLRLMKDDDEKNENQ